MKVLVVARREFVATVATKGFVIGVLLSPILVSLVFLLLPLLVDESAPRVEGEVLVRDPTGLVTPGVRDYLAPERIAERRGALLGAGRAARAVLGQVPLLEVVRLEPSESLEEAKASLLRSPRRFALAVIDEDAVRTTEGSYELYVRGRLDDRIEREIHDAVRDAIVSARARARGLDRAEIEAVTRVPYRRSTTVTEEGERETRLIERMLPLVFMGLVLLSVIVSGQYLLTTTIEEKQNRVVEMLLSAVSPTELMTGKILGQLAVGLLILTLYAGVGVLALASFALAGAVSFGLLAYGLASYFIAFVVIASLMAAIGAAVNELREAQTLMTPLMLVIVLPWLLAMPISRSPDSTLAVVTSFVPPLNTFVMLLRITSGSPPPWQVAASLVVGIASIGIAFCLAGKVFRVGLLMHGKPPDLRTLVRWVRMA